MSIINDFKNAFNRFKDTTKHQISNQDTTKTVDDNNSDSYTPRIINGIPTPTDLDIYKPDLHEKGLIIINRLYHGLNGNIVTIKSETGRKLVVCGRIVGYTILNNSNREFLKTDYVAVNTLPWIIEKHISTVKPGETTIINRYTVHEDSLLKGHIFSEKQYFVNFEVLHSKDANIDDSYIACDSVNKEQWIKGEQLLDSNGKFIDRKLERNILANTMYIKHKYSVVGRVMQGTSVLGYCIQNDLGENSVVDKPTLVKIAMYEGSSNCKTKTLDGETTVYGTGGTHLDELPVMKVEKDGSWSFN